MVNESTLVESVTNVWYHNVICNCFDAINNNNMNNHNNINVNIDPGMPNDSIRWCDA